MRIDDDSFVIGGGDDVDEMEQQIGGKTRSKRQEKPAKKMPEKPVTDALCEPVVIGGDEQDDTQRYSSSRAEEPSAPVADEQEPTAQKNPEIYDEVVIGGANEATDNTSEAVYEEPDRAHIEVQEARADAMRARAEAEKARVEVERAKAEALMARAEAEKAARAMAEAERARAHAEAEQSALVRSEVEKLRAQDAQMSKAQEKDEQTAADKIGNVHKAADATSEAIAAEKTVAAATPDNDSAAVVRPRDMAAVKAAKAAAKVPGEDASSGTGEQDFRKEFLVTASPHIHCGETTRILMQDVLIALTPAAIMSVVYFGWRAAMLIAVCMISCVLTEFVCRKVMKRRQTISDGSAAVTGIILAFCLPPEINPLFAVVGSIVAIVAVKQMFGGIGMNFANPAATARIVLMLSFPVAMTTYSSPFFYYLDATSGATPLAIMGGTAQGQMPSLLELFLGYHGGCLGETCAVALLLGGGYLLLRGVISWHIPVSFMGTVVVIALIAGENPLVHLLSGGVVLGAMFMATDYVTSPINKKGQIIFGFGCGLLTMAIRLFGSMSEGVSFAILLMNILTPHIERLTMPKPFGEEREAA